MNHLTDKELKRVRLAGKLAVVGKQLCYLAFVILVGLVIAALVIRFGVGLGG